LSCAIWISYLNVDGWRTNPAVVTSVDVVKVENNVLLPTITICPVSSRARKVVMDVFNNPEFLSQNTTIQFRRSFDLLACGSSIMSYIQSPYTIQRNLESLKAQLKNQTSALCSPPSNSMKETCELVAILIKIQGFVRLKKNVKGVAIHHSVQETLSQIRGQAEYDNSSVDLNLVQKVLKDVKMEKTVLEANFDDEDWTNVIRGYLILTSKLAHEFSTTMRFELIPWDKIPNQGDCAHLKAIDNYGTYLLISAGKDSSLSNQIKDMSMKAINSYLGLDGTVPLEQIASTFLEFQPQTEFMHPCLRLQQGFKSCQNSSRLDQSCRHYCQLVGNATKSIPRLTQILRFFYPGENAPTREKVFKSFPLCKRPGFPLTTNCLDEILTENGLCFALNTPKWSNESNLFHEIRAVQTNDLGQGQKLAYDFGDSFGMHKVFDLEVPRTANDDLNSFVMSIGSMADSSSLSNAFQILMEPGWSTYLGFVASSSVENTDAFMAMDPASRECYGHYEKNLKWFDFYSKSNCLLECAWSNAQEHCGCVPWYLKEKIPKATICEFMGHACFQKIVRERSTNPKTRYRPTEWSNFPQWKQKCEIECLNDCEAVHYELKTLSARPLRTNTKKCPTSGSKGENWLVCDYRNFSDAAVSEQDRTFAYKLGYGKYINSWGTLRSELSFIEVHMIVQTLTRITKTATVTPIDMISNIGGTIGLFSGCSILS
ncbi:hypothetical protein TCAL_12995, partial [Tigriopus californicus]